MICLNRYTVRETGQTGRLELSSVRSGASRIPRNSFPAGVAPWKPAGRLREGTIATQIGADLGEWSINSRRSVQSERLRQRRPQKRGVGDLIRDERDKTGSRPDEESVQAYRVYRSSQSWSDSCPVVWSWSDAIVIPRNRPVVVPRLVRVPLAAVRIRRRSARRERTRVGALRAPDPSRSHCPPQPCEVPRGQAPRLHRFVHVVQKWTDGHRRI